ncbi:MAG: dihydroorotase [Solirubrobacteraceae bacterium]
MPSRPADLLVAGAHVLDPRVGLDEILDVLVLDGEVAEVAKEIAPPAGVEEIAAAGAHLFPAFVDPHVHLRVPGEEHKEDLETGTRAAAAGGFGAVIGMPNTRPPIDSASVLRSVRELAEVDARVPVGFLAAATVGQRGVSLTEMAELRDAGALGFTDDGRPIASANVLRRALQYQRLCGGVVALHEEDPTLSGDGAMHEGSVSALLGLAGIPSISESTMIARDAAIAAYEGGRIHAQHLSAAESVDAVAAAKAAGVRITAEVTPHHLVLTHEDVRTLDTALKFNPPARSGQDRAALVDALRDGTIDCVATDHAPHAPHEKEVPFEEAPMGTTGLETAFAALNTFLVEPGLLSLDLVVERMTAGGAPFGLPEPRIAPGELANLALVGLDRAWQPIEAGYESRSENCCFHERELRGRVLMTVAAGAIAYRERSFALSAA